MGGWADGARGLGGSLIYLGGLGWCVCVWWWWWCSGGGGRAEKGGINVEDEEYPEYPHPERQGARQGHGQGGKGGTTGVTTTFE